jgi:ABC-type antimicrobial peptide transport system permease subunit
VARAVRAEVRKLDPDLQLADLTTLKTHFAFDRDSMDAEHSELAKQAAVSPVFALIALLLAAIGLYAVISHSVSQRTKEIGVRMAIGAAAGDIRGMVLRDGILPVAIGMIVGLGASLAVNRILQSQLVGVSPYDPITMAGAPVVLILVALPACLIPARRAMNVDPAVALRHD